MGRVEIGWNASSMIPSSSRISLKKKVAKFIQVVWYFSLFSVKYFRQIGKGKIKRKPPTGKSCQIWALLQKQVLLLQSSSFDFYFFLSTIWFLLFSILKRLNS